MKTKCLYAKLNSALYTVGSLEVSAAPASIIIWFIRQEKSCKPAEIQRFSHCGRNTNEAAVGVLGVVMDGSSEAVPFELDLGL